MGGLQMSVLNVGILPIDRLVMGDLHLGILSMTNLHMSAL